MKIQCPYCKEQYDIHRAILAKANYTLVCCNCRLVFTANPNEILAADNGPRKEPAEVEVSELLEEMEQTLANLKKNKASAKSRLPLALDNDIPEEMSVLQAEEVPPELLAHTRQAEKPRPSAGLILAALALALAVIAQLAWLNRDTLLQQPQIRSLAQQWCPRIGCRLPPTAEEIRFVLADRHFSREDSGNYRLQLLLRNDSDSAQLPPVIQLTLLDIQQKLSARRTLDPHLYLGSEAAATRKLAPGESLEVDLLFSTPGKGVTGFELELLPRPS